MLKPTNISLVMFLVFGALVSHGGWSGNVDHSSSVSIGYEVGSIANGLAKSIRVSSPSFFSTQMRVTGSAIFGWAQNVTPKNETSTTWAHYGMYKAGIIVGEFLDALSIRISGIAEAVAITPSKKLSSSAVVWGMSGAIDFEFFADPSRRHALVLNLGGVGLFSPYFADNLKGIPTVANGFTTAFGYRFFF